MTITSTDASIDISIVTRSTLDGHATDMSIDYRPRVYRCFYRASTGVGRGIDRDHIGSLSVNYRRNVGRISFDSWARVYAYYVPIYRTILSTNISTYTRYYLPIYRPLLSTDPRYYRPMYRPIYWLILDPIHQYINRYQILSTDVSTNVSADASTDTRAFIDRSTLG